MSFKADATSIADFGERLNDLVADANKAVDYVEEWLSFGHAEGRMFVTATSAAEDARAALTANYERLVELQRAASSEVDSTAAFYRDTDSGEAEQLDQSYAAEERA